MNALRSQELADAAGVNLQTIRYYERQRLLPKPPRTPQGHRIYPPEAVRRVRFIKRAQALGFTLKEIRDLLLLRVTPGRGCADVRTRARAKIEDVDEKIAALRAMREALDRLVATCRTDGPLSACPILDALDAEP
jgi:MerR family mercuric resistance operon transcriptional regulator